MGEPDPSNEDTLTQTAYIKMHMIIITVSYGIAHVTIIIISDMNERLLWGYLEYKMSMKYGTGLLIGKLILFCAKEIS